MERGLGNKKGQAPKRSGLTILAVVADLCAISTVIYWLISNM